MTLFTSFLLMKRVGSSNEMSSHLPAVWKRVYSVLSSFRDIFFALNRILIFCNSNINCSKQILDVFMRKKRFVSWTNTTGCRKLYALYKSLINIMNNRGDKMEPCGKPHLMSWKPVLIFIFSINCFLFEK